MLMTSTAEYLHNIYVEGRQEFEGEREWGYIGAFLSYGVRSDNLKGVEFEMCLM